ncbi:GNAT family N-acetyltransferase [Echinimonas agarilytica]|uniref:GNAT family N-acetyltransferase n=1 Tax=Echinimonas agarilytica TaxID=1215918 RepID=A0AA41W902_9GAMM|nr:GNAT family N-acetyltransferase [Echinimonas agarilytica]MCM2680777.1 GNAT family N-acetyltransferase [Echinimonas agarilytica]
MKSTFDIRQVTWQKAQHSLRLIRHQVFVCELRVPLKDEFDDDDKTAWHLLAFNQEQQPIATGRLCHTGEIGRIAVLINYRDKGIGSAIAQQLFALAQDKQLEHVFMNPELDCLSQFSSCNPHPVGPVFMEAGVPHQQLTCDCKTSALPDLAYLH